MKTDSPGERRESQGWCQEILRVMNWNLLIRDWKIQPEADPIPEYVRGRTGRRKHGQRCCLHLPAAGHTWCGESLGLLFGAERDWLQAGAELGKRLNTCHQEVRVEFCRWQGWKGDLWQDPIWTPKHKNGHDTSPWFSSGTWNLHLKPAKNLDPAGICTDALRIWP